MRAVVAFRLGLGTVLEVPIQHDETEAAIVAIDRNGVLDAFDQKRPYQAALLEHVLFVNLSPWLRLVAELPFGDDVSVANRLEARARRIFLRRNDPSAETKSGNDQT